MNFNDLNILVIGDLMVDEYLIGKSNRLSPEAPVPVICEYNTLIYPGGAANVALNLSKLGVKANCAGIVGNDKYGNQLINILKENNIDTSSIMTIDNYKTIIKKRIISNNKQICRIDIEEKNKNNFFEKIIGSINNKFDLVIISDYDKNLINKKGMKLILEKSISKKGFLIDPKKIDFSIYKNYSSLPLIVTPNTTELEKVSKQKINDNEKIKIISKTLIDENNFEGVLTTCGEKGMVYTGKNNLSHIVDAHNIDKIDVTGAGDTVIAAFAAFYASTSNIKKSLFFANLAAAKSVSLMGTASPSIEEIIDFNKKYFNENFR